MKHNILALTIFILFFGTVAAIGQTPAYPLVEGTFKADNGAPADSWKRETLLITVTKGKNGYEVSGEMGEGDDNSCSIHGEYLPTTGRLRGRCNNTPIEGFKVTIKGKDALQIRQPFSAIAKLVGGETTENTKVEADSDEEAYSDKNSHFSLSGTWKCDDGGTYTLNQSGTSHLTWEAKSSDGGATWNHTFTGAIEGNELKGSFQDGDTGTVHQHGKLTFKIISNNRLERTFSEVPFGCSVLVRQL